MAPADKRVVTLRKSAAEPRIRLICFAYAGGNPELFRLWADSVPEDVELLALRLPGHGARVGEKPYQDWKPLVTDTLHVLEPYLTGPHAFYGHSFGARLAYELVHAMTVPQVTRTARLFVSGCRSPDYPQAHPYMHEMSDERFLGALRDMGGTPGEILSSPVMLRVILPVVRSEIRLAELWHDWHHHGVPVPLTALYGRDDPVDSRQSMVGWSRYGTRETELLEVPGGHFMLETHHGALLQEIHARLGGFEC